MTATHTNSLAFPGATASIQTESFFGPPGRTIRELYHVTELIDDVCLLEPR